MMISVLSRISLIFLAAGIPAYARSFVGVTSWPSFRLGNDLGRFEWFADIQWGSWSATGKVLGQRAEANTFSFVPSLGCNIELLDSTFKAYVGGTLGMNLDFINGQYTDQYSINALAGGGIEFPLSRKLSLVGEYMLGCTAVFAAKEITDGWERQWIVFPRPSVQMRYYIGPW